MPWGPHLSPFGRWTALLLISLLPCAVAAGDESDPVAALDMLLSMAESSLQKGELEAAERHYRAALIEGWLLLGTLQTVERRWEEAREAFQEASLLSPEHGIALRSLASALLQVGEAAQAVDVLTSLAAKDPRDTETRRLLARALAAAGQLERAVQTLDEASVAADDPELAYLLATEYLWLKRVASAERLFSRMLEARPVPQSRVLIARTYRDAGEYDRARAMLRDALAQDPSVRRAHYYLGMVILADPRTGPDRLESAIAEFQAELNLEPQDAPANDQLGLALLDAGRPAEALVALETAVRGHARSLYLHHLGRGLLALERPADAVATLKRALALAQEENAGDAELGGIRYQLGLALRKLGQAPEAASHLAEARRLTAQQAALSPTAPVAPLLESSPLAELPLSQRRETSRRVRAGLARAYLNLGVMQAQGAQFTRAAELFDKAAELDPDLPRVHYSLGVAYFNAKHYEKATGPLSRALLATPEDAALKRMLAMAWLNSGQYAKAAELLQGDPELSADPSLQFAYGLALVRSERAAEAQPVFARLLKAHGDSAELSVLVGQAHAQQGDYEGAIEALRRALRLKPDVAEANATLGVIYLKQGKLAEAEAALRAELRTHPSDVSSQQNLAIVLDSLQRRGEAIVLLRKVLESRPDLPDARYLLGKALVAEGATAEGAEQLQAAAKAAPEDANIRYQLGQAYQKLGRTEQAEREFEEFRRLKEKSRRAP